MRKISVAILTVILCFVLTMMVYASEVSLRSGRNWYPSDIDRESITGITFQLEMYEGEYTDTWQASTGVGYTGYLVEDTIIISANDAEEIVLPAQAAQMFLGFSAVTEINGLEYLNTSNVTNMCGMFQECSSLTDLDISSFNTSKVTNMSNMFDVGGKYYKGEILGESTTSSLTNLTLGSIDTSKVTDMSAMFEDCDSLTTLDLSGFDTSSVKDMHFMFHNCCSLTDLDLSSFDTSNVTDFSQMFYDCISLSSLDVSSFDISSATDVRFMFNSLWEMEEFDLSNFGDNQIKNFRGMFWDCKNVTKIDLSNMSTEEAVDTTNVFGYCPKLTAVIVPDDWRIPDSRDFFYNDESEIVEATENEVTEEDIDSVNPSGDDIYDGEVIENDLIEETPVVIAPPVVVATYVSSTTSSGSSGGGGGGSSSGGGGGAIKDAVASVAPTGVTTTFVPNGNGKTLIKDSTGKAITNSWILTKGQWYMTGADGYAVTTGLAMTPDGKYYSFDSTTCAMRNTTGTYNCNGTNIFIEFDRTGFIKNPSAINALRSIYGDTVVGNLAIVQ